MTTLNRAVAFGFPGIQYTFSSFTNFTINAATDRVEWILQAPEAATITKLGFRYGARTGTPVAHTIALQGVDTSGNPNGTPLGGGSPASGAFTPPADTTWNGLIQWVTLDNSIALTRGQMVSIVITPTGVPDGSNNSSFTVTALLYASMKGFPCAIQNDAGVRTRQQSAPVWLMQSASKTYGLPYQSANATTFSTTTEHGFRFTLPGPIGGTFKVAGIQAVLSLAASKSFVMTLYSGTTPLQTVTFDGDIQSAAANARVWELYFTDTTLSTLKYGTEYRIGFAPAEASANMVVGAVVAAAAGEVTALFGGQNFLLCTRASGGGTAWTDSATTTRPLCTLILEDATGYQPRKINGGLVQ